MNVNVAFLSIQSVDANLDPYFNSPMIHFFNKSSFENWKHPWLGLETFSDHVQLVVHFADVWGECFQCAFVCGFDVLTVNHVLHHILPNGVRVHAYMTQAFPLALLLRKNCAV